MSMALFEQLEPKVITDTVTALHKVLPSPSSFAYLTFRPNFTNPTKTLLDQSIKGFSFRSSGTSGQGIGQDLQLATSDERVERPKRWYRFCIRKFHVSLHEKCNHILHAIIRSLSSFHFSLM